MANDTSAPTSARVRLRRIAVQAAAAAALFAGAEFAARRVGERVRAAEVEFNHLLQSNPGARRPAWMRAFAFTLDPVYRNDLYLGFAGTSPLYVPAEGGAFTTAENKQDKYRIETFPRAKPAGGIRIFCLGGSSVRSDAFDDKGTFPWFLQQAIAQAVGPGRSVEVINSGGGGTGSYQYREVAHEVRGYDADLIVVYPEAGERRFLTGPESEMAERDSSSPWRADVRRVLASSRLYSGMRDALQSLRTAAAPPGGLNATFALAAYDAAARPFSPTTFTRILEFKKDAVPPLMKARIPRDQIDRAHERFVQNMVALVGDARAAGVPVLLVDSLRNLKADFYRRFHVEAEEFVQEPGMLRKWQQTYESALELRRAGRWEKALEEFAKVRACYKTDRDEILALYMGGCFEALGKYPEALQEYERHYVHRAFRRRLQDVAARTGAPLLDPYPALVAAAPHGIPDESMFTDSFHPHMETNRVIAMEILRAIGKEKLLPGFDLRPAQTAAVKAALERASTGIDVNPRRKIQIAVYANEFEKAVQLAKAQPLESLNYLELMYLGWAQARTHDLRGAQATYDALRKQLMTGGAAPASLPPLETKADIVANVFDGDLFSEF